MCKDALSHILLALLPLIVQVDKKTMAAVFKAGISRGHPGSLKLLGIAERFLDEYVAAADALGYLPMDPLKLGSQREFLFFNEELKKYFAFDLFPGEDEANITLEFVSIEPDEASYLESVLRR